MKRLVEEGSWGNDISWELYHSNEQPDETLCTAIFCIALDSNSRIVMMRAERGWGMLGGHIEEGESLVEALSRESIEEGGFTPKQPHFFGFRKIISSRPMASQYPAKSYPFPTSYILYYWATTDEEIVAPSGIEVLESKSFTLDEIRQLNTPDLSTIELALEDYSYHKV